MPPFLFIFDTNQKQQLLCFSFNLIDVAFYYHFITICIQFTKIATYSVMLLLLARGSINCLGMWLVNAYWCTDVLVSHCLRCVQRCSSLAMLCLAMVYHFVGRLVVKRNRTRTKKGPEWRYYHLLLFWHFPLSISLTPLSSTQLSKKRNLHFPVPLFFIFTFTFKYYFSLFKHSINANREALIIHTWFGQDMCINIGESWSICLFGEEE